MDDPSSYEPSSNPPLDEVPQHAPAAVGAGAAVAATAPAISSDLHSFIPPLLRPGHELPFVQPSSYLRPKLRTRTVPAPTPPMSPIDEEQLQGLVSYQHLHSNIIIPWRSFFVLPFCLPSGLPPLGIFRPQPLADLSLRAYRKVCAIFSELELFQF